MALVTTTSLSFLPSCHSLPGHSSVLHYSSDSTRFISFRLRVTHRVYINNNSDIIIRQKEMEEQLSVYSSRMTEQVSQFTTTRCQMSMENTATSPFTPTELLEWRLLYIDFYWSVTTGSCGMRWSLWARASTWTTWPACPWTLNVAVRLFYPDAWKQQHDTTTCYNY